MSEKRFIRLSGEGKPIDKSKVDERTRSFVEFFENEFGVTFVDVTDQVAQDEMLERSGTDDDSPFEI